MTGTVRLYWSLPTGSVMHIYRECIGKNQRDAFSLGSVPKLWPVCRRCEARQAAEKRT